MYISAAMNREETAKEFMRRQAVLQSGYSFIVLQLKDAKKRRVSAIDTLIANPVESQDNPGMIDFEFKTKTGPLVFEKDATRGGMYTGYVLDTEFNRQFLGTHYGYGFWKIVDVISGTVEGEEGKEPITLQKIIADVKARYEASLKVTVRKTIPPDPMSDTHREMTDEDLEGAISKLEEIKRRREAAKAQEKEMKKIPMGILRKRGRPRNEDTNESAISQPPEPEIPSPEPEEDLVRVGE
jgi:hypothetical protein